MQAADSWHYLAKQWLIVTDFPDGHSNNWRRATNPAIRFHLAEDSTTAVFSFPTHSSRAFCCSSGLLSMQQIELQWAGKSCFRWCSAELSPPPPSTLPCISLHYSCTVTLCGERGLNASAEPSLLKAFAFKGDSFLWEKNPKPTQESEPVQTGNSVQLVLSQLGELLQL